MIEVRILDKNHVEAASGLRLARLHRAAELIRELDTGVKNTQCHHCDCDEQEAVEKI